MDKQTERGFVLSKEYNMKNRWGLFSAAIFFGFLSSQVIAADSEPTAASDF
jgi:hypothetical protein